MFLKKIFLVFSAVGVSACSDGDWYADQDPMVKSILIGENGPPSLEVLRQYSDVLRAAGYESELLNDPALYRVTTDFGATVIDLKRVPYKSSAEEASVKPWSSWWYPKLEDSLFRDTNGSYSSPLTKYDYYRRLRSERDNGSKPGSAAQIESKQFRSDALKWEGLCNAWALAAILSPEPKKPVTREIKTRWGRADKINFSVGDLKALLLKTYEGIKDEELKIYGQKFTGDYEGWFHPDLFPDQFHRFLEVQVFQRHKAFVMDHDPGVEVWNVPVYKANYSLELVSEIPNAVAVRMWVYSAGSTIRTDPDYLNFVGTKQVVREYHYVLIGDLSAEKVLTVRAGIWIRGKNGVDSRKDHPDYLIAAPEFQNVQRLSFNAEIKNEIVDEILQGSTN